MHSSRSRLVPLFIALTFLSGCAGASVQSSCPPPRYPDEKVGAELETVPFEGYEDFWQWMSDIEALNEQLDACR